MVGILCGYCIALSVLKHTILYILVASFAYWHASITCLCFLVTVFIWSPATPLLQPGLQRPAVVRTSPWMNASQQKWLPCIADGGTLNVCPTMYWIHTNISHWYWYNSLLDFFSYIFKVQYYSTATTTVADDLVLFRLVYCIFVRVGPSTIYLSLVAMQGCHYIR